MNTIYDTIYHLLGIGMAGAAGTLARYGVSVVAAVLLGTSYPWGTYLVNMLGCFLFGIVSGLITSGSLSAEWKTILLTGFLGGFTTFSAFAAENQQFLSERRWNALMLHLIGQNLLGIVAVLGGLILANLFIFRK
ncbi:MAG: CrcB family protein [Planctomycetaceae bacterium]|jgi:CrcB protein|nr:CrcB family protein [Planctomycetaceae bacterium]